MIKYVKIFCDISETVDVLSDAEAGRLLKAMLHYGMDGTVDQLPGQEKLVFCILKAQIDRDRESYDQKSQRNRENGAKGGRPKKPTETQENPVGFAKSEKNPQKPTKRQDKDKEYIPPYSPPTGGEDDEDELLAIAEGHNAVFDRARECGFDLNQATLDRLTDLIGVHGADRVLSALDDCLEHGAKSLAYLRKVLANAGTPAPAQAQKFDWLY